MARIVWIDPALQDLDTIADYIALNKPVAATKLLRAAFTNSNLALFSKMVLAS